MGTSVLVAPCWPRESSIRSYLRPDRDVCVRRIETGVDSRPIRHRLKSDACDWTKCYKWNMGTVRISGPRSRRARRARQRIDNEGE